MTEALYLKLDEVLRNAREHEIGALVHPLLTLHVEGDTSMRVLQERMGRTSSANVTGLANRLVRRGWAERIHGDTDRRMVFLRLTPAGRELAEGIFGKLEA